MVCSATVAVAEWSEALSSFFCTCSCESPDFEPSHGTHWKATVVVDRTNLCVKCEHLGTLVVSCLCKLIAEQLPSDKRVH